MKPLDYFVFITVILGIAFAAQSNAREIDQLEEKYNQLIEQYEKP